MIKNRKASAMMLTVFISILLVSIMLFSISNIVETSIRYIKSNNETILSITKDRNRNERIYTNLYKIVNLVYDEEELTESLKNFNSFDLRYKSGPIFTNNNKMIFKFIDSNKNYYKFLIEGNIGEDKVNLYRIY